MADVGHGLAGGPNRRSGPRRLLGAVVVLCIAAIAATGPWALLDRDEAAGHVSHPETPHVAPWPAPGGAAVVWAVGDGGDGNATSRAVAARIARDGLDRLLYLGDVYTRGTAADFASDYRPTYGSLAAITWPTPGNHEWPRRASGYDPYWRRIAGRAQPPWYARRTAGWEVLSLNSEAPHGRRSAQLRWLRRHVRSGGTCRIAIWHRPRFSAATVGDQPDVAPLWDAIRGRAAIVLNGHAHDMQRFQPIHGVTELVAGAGGHRLHPVDPTDPRLAFANDRTFGALRLVLRPGRATYAFVAASGRVLDSGAIGCHRP